MIKVGVEKLLYLVDFLVDLSNEGKEGIYDRVKDAVGYPVWTLCEPY